MRIRSWLEARRPMEVVGTIGDSGSRKHCSILYVRLYYLDDLLYYGSQQRAGSCRSCHEYDDALETESERSHPRVLGNTRKRICAYQIIEASHGLSEIRSF
jgi:hypothetical protein